MDALYAPCKTTAMAEFSGSPILGSTPSQPARKQKRYEMQQQNENIALFQIWSQVDVASMLHPYFYHYKLRSTLTLHWCQHSFCLSMTNKNRFHFCTGPAYNLIVCVFETCSMHKAQASWASNHWIKFRPGTAFLHKDPNSAHAGVISTAKLFGNF